MRLKILGSSSSGNGYLLETREETLVLEAGVKLMEIKKALDFNISQIVGALITHEHGDHAAFAKEYINAGIATFMSEGTKKALKIKKSDLDAKTISPPALYKIGQYTVIPFDAEHDAQEPLGFLISHPIAGKILFATDTADLDKYEFRGLNHIMIEANYSQEIAEKRMMAGSLNARHHARVESTHMSIEQVQEFLERTDRSQLKNIILLHLSDGNADAAKFQSEIERQTGVRTTIADKGIEINLSKNPF